jgi:hypothetical protein
MLWCKGIEDFFSPRKIKKILGTVKASAASVNISCVSCCVVFLEKMERALSIWLKDDILERAVSLWHCGNGEGQLPLQ